MTNKPPARDMRTVLAVALFVLFCYDAPKPYYIQFLFADMSGWHDMLTAAPDRGDPGFPEFLSRVLELTPPGAEIAVIIPSLAWNRDYPYAMFRSDYLLENRRVLSVFLPNGQPNPRVQQAQFIAAWRVDPPEGYRVVERIGRGALAVRK